MPLAPPRSGVLRLGVVLAGVAAAVVATAVTTRADGFGVTLFLWLFAGWAFVASGTAGLLRRPENPVGALMILIGAVWCVARVLRDWDASVPLLAGIWLGDLWLLPFAVLLAGFPLMRVRGRADRALLGVLVVVLVPLEAVWLAFQDFERAGGPGTPANPLLVSDRPGLVETVDTVQRALLTLALLGLAIVLVRRWRRASTTLRRVLAPVLAGAAALVMFLVSYLLSKFEVNTEIAFATTLIVLAAVPLIFLAGLLRARLARSSLGDLLVDLREPPAPGALRDSLARALRDPTLELAYWVPEYRAYAGADGEVIALPSDGRVATFVERRGEPVAALIHDASLRDEPELVGAVTSAAGIALENERLQADLRARLSDLRTSRTRIVEAGDAARRRLERDLHDGAQQRLVSLALLLRLVAAKLPAGSAEAKLLATAREELAASLEELRGIAQGIHPAVLSDHGLAVALESLAARAPVPVTLAVALEQRPPQPVEIAVYYLVAEGLTNVAKYARATKASVTVTRRGDTLAVEVVDDGRGGADPAGGSGLRGLADRVEALDGRLQVWSPPGGGTRLRAEIPCA